MLSEFISKQERESARLRRARSIVLKAFNELHDRGIVKAGYVPMVFRSRCKGCGYMFVIDGEDVSNILDERLFESYMAQKGFIDISKRFKYRWAYSLNGFV